MKGRMKLILSTIFALFFLPFFSSLSVAGVSLPYSGTFNCSADWVQGNSLPSGCTEITLGQPNTYASCTTGDNHSRINDAGNNPAGGGGKGFRIAIGDGVNNLSATVQFQFSSPNDVYIRWYMRYPLGYVPNLGYHKLAGVIVDGVNKGDWDIFTDHVGFYPIGGDSQWRNGDTGKGFNWVNGGATGDGKFHCYELHESSTGVLEFWIDGTKVMTGNTNNLSGNAFDRVMFNINQSSPSNGGCVYIDYDDVAISGTGYIGPIGYAHVAPSPPTNLRIIP